MRLLYTQYSHDPLLEFKIDGTIVTHNYVNFDLDITEARNTLLIDGIEDSSLGLLLLAVLASSRIAESHSLLRLHDCLTAPISLHVVAIKLAKASAIHTFI